MNARIICYLYRCEKKPSKEIFQSTTQVNSYLQEALEEEQSRSYPGAIGTNGSRCANHNDANLRRMK